MQPEYIFKGTPELFLSIIRGYKDVNEGRVYLLEKNTEDKNYTGIWLYSRYPDLVSFVATYIDEDFNVRHVHSEPADENASCEISALLLPDSKRSKLRIGHVSGEWSQIEPHLTRLIEYLKQDGWIEEKTSASEPVSLPGSWALTATIHINDWPKREFMTFERVRLEDFHRWFTKYHLNKWNVSITPKEKQNSFVQMTFLEVNPSDGENTYVFRGRESNAVVAVIIAERFRIDELRLYAEWFEPADGFINYTIGNYCIALDLPFFDWMKPPAAQSDAPKEASTSHQVAPEIVVPQTPMLSPAEQDWLIIILQSEYEHHHQAKKYMRFCLDYGLTQANYESYKARFRKNPSINLKQWATEGRPADADKHFNEALKQRRTQG